MDITLNEFLRLIQNTKEYMALIEVYYSNNPSFTVTNLGLLGDDSCLQFCIGSNIAGNCISEQYAKAKVKELYICENRKIRVLLDKLYVDDTNSLETLELTGKLYLSLTGSGVEKISDLISMTVEEFEEKVSNKKFRNMGEKGCAKVIEAVHNHGYKFKDE